MSDVWDHLLKEVSAAHTRLPALAAFCDFPDHVSRQSCAAKHDPLSDQMRGDKALQAPAELRPLRDAFCAAAPAAQWRETYLDTAFGTVLHAHFGCYEVLGKNTPLGAEDIRSFVIYQLSDFHYPMHHHPAEELYLVVAGEGEFHLEGQSSRHLGPGDTAIHPSSAPHALTTSDKPIMAYVIWRGDLTTKPVWSYPEDMQ